jgi:tetratricopeptide (TPR) repeat protein
MIKIIILLSFIMSGQVMAKKFSLSQSYALEKNKQYQKAAEMIEQMKESKYWAELVYLRLGWLSYLQGNYGDSLSYYQEAIDINKNSIDAHLGLTLPYMAQKRYRTATKEVENILDRSPNNYAASAKMMYLLSVRQKWGKLKSFAKNVSTHYPTLVEPLVYLARSYSYSGDTDMAKKVYQKVLFLMPTHVEAIAAMK